MKLSSRSTVEQAFRRIVRACLADVMANGNGVICEDSESIHQMRVAIRRLRSCFKLFEELVPVPQAFQEGIGALGVQLGQARDWDVFSASTLPKISRAAPDDASLENLRRAAGEKAKRKREEAAAAVRGAQYTRLMQRMSAWLDGARWRRELDVGTLKRLRASVREFADKMLRQDQRQLLKRGRHLPHADASARHRVRIAAKKTRYATEFFSSLYPKRRVRPYVDVLSGLQDELGWLNDVAVAGRLLGEFQQAEIDAAGLAHGIGYVRGFLSSVIDLERPKLSKMWKRFVPLKVPCG